MVFHRALLILVLLLPVYLVAGAALNGADPKPAGTPRKDAAPSSFNKKVVPFLTRYCVSCHSGSKPKAGLVLDGYKDETAAGKDRQVWEKVAANLRSRDMPPPKRPQPTLAETEAVTGWIDGVLSRMANGKKDPGRVTMRRLNRAEYNNTIRDLVGVSFKPANDFPSDDVGYGFDNIGDVLSLPPLLLEKYLAAADKIVTQAFASPDTRRRIMIVQPSATSRAEDARKIIAEFARRAYRRPVTPDEVNRLTSLVSLAEKQGDGFDKGIQLALQAILVSPHFLFRVELDREPANAEAIHLVNDFELASRLSYFLWSSMPDEELYTQAAKGNLRKGAYLDAQVRRMLKDPRYHALVENFAGQWLQTRNLKNLAPDSKLFPDFDEALRSAMVRETELLFEAVIREDRSILDFLDSEFTFLNERLAKHYGIAGVKGDQFQRVKLTGDQRGGLLTQASILTVTSNPTRTSPVKRGKWILENILGAPPPPPPPEAGELSQDKKVVEASSLRKRMEQHRSNPSCASCHERMDPLGFGLENFDAIGAWRGKDGNFPVDASGTLPGGQSFQGPRELKTILKTRQDAFRRCLSEKLLTYALGRGLESYDRPAVEEISRTLARNGHRFSSLVLAIVKSDPFQKRRGVESKP